MALNANAAEVKAEGFLAEGEKTLKKFSLFSSGTKFEDASDLFEKSGNQFKIAKKWAQAGMAYAKCADMQLKMKDSASAARFYQTAADAFRKESPTEAVSYYQTAISMLCDAGKFTSAAKMQKEIAEIYETEENYEEAIMNYRQAADYYAGENQQSSANTNLLKVAQLSAQLENYDAAMEIYQDIAKNCMESNLLKFNAKGHLLNAGICCLALKDQVVINQKRELYDEIDFSFSESREGKFFNNLAQSFEDYDVDAFSDAVFQFDNISKLDTWKITLLLRVKESISTGVDEAVSLT